MHKLINKRRLGQVLSVLVAIPVVLVLTLFFYPRPHDETPAWVFEGDASTIDYCARPILDGSGISAAEIPQGHTPNCGYDKFPQPILKGCTEPLMEGADDLRGLWRQTKGGRIGHIERIEQCGNRVVVTAGGLIHDMTGDGKLSGSSNDVGLFRLGPLRLCVRTSATTEWHEKQLHFYAFGGPHVVSRYLEGDELIWIYPGFGTTRMERICKLPSGS